VTVAVHFPRSPVGKRFCEFFSHRYSFIEASVNGSDRPKWRTVRDYPIEHRNLWNRFLAPDTLVGLSFGSTTHYALLDIDRGSPYHPFNDEKAFKQLLGEYEDLGFNDRLLIQSSLSEGIHLYFPLPKEVPTHKLAVMLKFAAIRAGFTVKNGWLEIFPNPKPYSKDGPTSYKAHRLPLQVGSFLLDKDYQPYSSDIEVFLDQAERAANAQDIGLIEKAIEAASQAKSFRYIKGDSSKAAAFAKDLQEQIQEGWSDFGQTNDLLRIIGTYGRVFEGLEGFSLADFIASTAKCLPGYGEFCRHQHQIEKRAKEWASCIEKFYYPYGSEPSRAGTFAQMVEQTAKENKVNDERQSQAIDRIKRGVEIVKEKLLQIPERVGEMKETLLRAIAELFGVRPSDKTLNRHRELWHPEFIGEKSEEAIAKDEPLALDPEQPEHLPEPDIKPCHTPCKSEDSNGHKAIGINPLSEADSEKSATPPLYMKVLEWADQKAKLLYRGKFCTGLVDLEGAKQSQIQGINPNETVIITDTNHSSFLYPNREDRLLVYVTSAEGAENWLSGIAVLARYLEPVLDE
jgi:hypothetical protein